MTLLSALTRTPVIPVSIFRNPVPVAVALWPPLKIAIWCSSFLPHVLHSTYHHSHISLCDMYTPHKMPYSCMMVGYQPVIIRLAASHLLPYPPFGCPPGRCRFRFAFDDFSEHHPRNNIMEKFVLRRTRVHAALLRDATHTSAAQPSGGPRSVTRKITCE